MRLRWPSGHLFDVVVTFATTLLGRGCYLALQVVLARTLGPERFGLYAIGWTVAGLAGTLAPIGMPQAMLRYSIGGAPSLRSRPMLIVLLAGFAATAVLMPGAGLIARHVFSEPQAAPIIRAFAPTVLLLGLFGVTSAALRACGWMWASGVTGTALFVIYLPLTIIVFWARPSAVMAADLYTVSIVVVLAANVVLLWRAPATDSHAPALRSLMHFGVVTMMIHSSSVLNIWADRVVIGILARPAELASYQVASQFAMIMVVLRSGVNTVFEARVPKQRAGLPPPDVSREFLAATRLLLHISVPGLLVLACTSGFWVRLLFGAPYEAAALPLIVLIAGQIASSLLGPTQIALLMTGEERRVMGLSIGTCLLNVAGCLALVPLLGASGAALATGIANTFVVVACMVRLLRTGRLCFSFASLRDILLAIAMCLGVSLLLVHLVGPLSIGLGIAITLAGYAAYGLCICLACTVEDEFVQLARPLLRRPFRGFASP